MAHLFDNDSDSDLELKTDTDYAKNYNTWRKKEELHKLQARYGDISSNSESSTEDDENELPEEDFDKDFFKTLSYLKTKDSRIYDKSFDFFGHSEETSSKSNKKKKKEQPMYIKDYERKLVLEKGGQLSDDDDVTFSEQSKPFTYNDEQNELKENLKNALENLEGEDADEKWGGLFKTREKTNQEQEREEDQYVQWLAGQSQTLKDESDENDLKPLKQFWNDPELEVGEKFLRDYILKKRFLEGEDGNYVPTYDEIVHDSDRDLSEDERAIDKQEEFEHKYNFRFEEPDQDFIKRYPRTMENSLRQKDDKRKVKRLERKERKTEEKKQKMQEINKLKELKKLEIEEKINKLKEITGNAEIAFDVKDFENDFDPDEHDKRMQSLFNEEFYQGPEGEQKPEFPDLDEELELENWDHWHGNDNAQDTNQDNDTYEETQPHCEDENFNMDCDYDPATTQRELINNSTRKKKRRRKSKFAKVLSEPKPVFDPNDRTYQEYLDEYYKLDCEDVIGDIPCRFKYRRVIPNDFGLSIEEILSAKDKELNRWCSIKKALQYRPEHVEKYDVIAFSKKAKNVELKKKYLPSLFESSESATASVANNEQVSKKKDTNEKTSHLEKQDTSQKPERKNALEENSIKNDTSEQKTTNNEDDSVKRKKKKKSEKNNVKSIKDSKANVKNKKRKLNDHDQNSEDVSKPKKHKTESSNKKNKRQKFKKTEPDIDISDARLAAYGFKPKKFKNKLKYGNAK